MNATSLTTLGHEHLAKAAGATAGRSAVTMHGGQGHSLRQTLIALTAGHRLGEHESPGEATLQVIHGTVVLHAGDDQVEARTGDHVVIPPVRHDLEALQDAVVLLTVSLSG
ncbi:hypothetical protein I601_2939 [Nocardioides dokdonensis FR1436]|uniref:Cupin domain protein n=1 Tax=Nocardioides dokdonensis FR1436 TaxID=1300347 RepID=A0A1A9GM50_9ACTN|nr:cupin domain-containing protein [Nocardioides dokdonensis]ANH39354.1 hypothetical protein I601_2939 [Nocardioides dokdonensis FR1436]